MTREEAIKKRLLVIDKVIERENIKNLWDKVYKNDDISKLFYKLNKQDPVELLELCSLKMNPAFFSKLFLSQILCFSKMLDIKSYSFLKFVFFHIFLV